MAQVQENAVKETDFQFPGQKKFYRGKVRDIYYFDQKMAMVVTDRISAFDVVLPKAIPYKGQVLNQIANEYLQATRDIVNNWVLDMPDPNVTVGLQCDPIPVEMVIRGYLAGHAWREYREGNREICGVTLPEGLHENDPLPEPIITPTTKAKTGHDEDISREEIIWQGLVDEDTYTMLEHYTRHLYARGMEMGKKRKLLLVDTKYEFGFYNGNIYLIDEIHTPDSSRYFYEDGFEARQQKGEPQKQLSKEFVRQWLIQEGFQGQPDQKIPEMTPEIVNAISERYIELFENLTGKAFIRNNTENILNRIYQNIIKSL